MTVQAHVEATEEKEREISELKAKIKEMEDEKIKAYIPPPL